MVQLFEPEGNGAADAACVPATEKNKDAPVTRTDLTNISFSSSGGDANVEEIAWTTVSLLNADWPLGDYKGGVDVVSIGSDQSYKISLRIMDDDIAGCVIDEIIGTSNSQSGTGPFLFIMSVIDPQPGTINNAFQMMILGSRGANHGNQSCTLVVNDVDSLMEVPFDAPVGAADQFLNMGGADLD